MDVGDNEERRKRGGGIPPQLIGDVVGKGRGRHEAASYAETGTLEIGGSDGARNERKIRGNARKIRRLQPFCAIP